MLTAGLITCVIAILKRFDTTYALTVLLAVLIIFYLIGLIARTVLTKVCFSKTDEEQPEDSEVADEAEEEIENQE